MYLLVGQAKKLGIVLESSASAISPCPSRSPLAPPISATPAALLFLEHTWHIPVLSSLHWLLLLLEASSPTYSHGSSSPFLKVSAQMSPPPWVLLYPHVWISTDSSSSFSCLLLTRTTPDLPYTHSFIMFIAHRQSPPLGYQLHKPRGPCFVRGSGSSAWHIAGIHQMSVKGKGDPKGRNGFEDLEMTYKQRLTRPENI